MPTEFLRMVAYYINYQIYIKVSQISRISANTMIVSRSSEKGERKRWQTYGFYWLSEKNEFFYSI